MAIDTSDRTSFSTDGDDGTARLPDEAAAGPGDRRRRAQRATLLVGVAILLVAGLLRLYGLDHPPRIYFDETYYANDANEYLMDSVERDFAVHPPVGKWLIAGGIAAFGFDPFGWRFAAAIAGTLTVGVVYLIGLRLFQRRGIAAVVALLVAVDGLAFTLSRIAMLDVFLMLFVATGFWLLLVDRDRQWAASAEPSAEEAVPLERGAVLPRRPHPWRLLAGVAFGLALATKWPAALAIAAAGVFVLISELLWRKRRVGTPWVALHRIVGSGLLCLVVIPALVYVASYIPWFANFAATRPGEDLCEGSDCNVTLPGMVGAWAGEQREILQFHRNLKATHPYRAAAYTWPVLIRPVAFYWESCTQDQQARNECDVAPENVGAIVNLGNPVVWWAALASYVVLAWVGIRRRDWRAGAIALFLGLQFLPWLAAPRPLFLFYAAPFLPFMVLSLGYTCEQAQQTQWWRWVPLALVVLAVAGFLFWYPTLSGQEIARSAWRWRMWLPTWV